MRRALAEASSPGLLQLVGATLLTLAVTGVCTGRAATEMVVVALAGLGAIALAGQR